MIDKRGITIYDLVLTGKFKKGLKLAKKRGLDVLVLTLVDTGTHSDMFKM